MAEESKFQTKILNDLRSLGKYCEVFKIIKTSDNFIPDVFFSTALTGGIFVETKRIKGRLSKGQCYKIESLNLCGSRSFACYDWAEWWELKRSLGLLSMPDIVNAHIHNKNLLSK